MESTSMDPRSKLALKCFAAIQEDASVKLDRFQLPNGVSNPSDNYEDKDNWVNIQSEIKNILADRWTKLSEEFISFLHRPPNWQFRKTMRTFVRRIYIEVKMTNIKPVIITAIPEMERNFVCRQTTSIDDRSTWIPVIPFLSMRNHIKVLYIVPSPEICFSAAQLLKKRFEPHISVNWTVTPQDLSPAACTYDLVVTTPENYLTYLILYGKATTFTHMFADTGACRFSCVPVQLLLTKSCYHPNPRVIIRGNWDFSPELHFMAPSYHHNTISMQMVHEERFEITKYFGNLISAVFKLHQEGDDRGGILVFAPSPGDCHKLAETLSGMDKENEFSISVLHEFLYRQPFPDNSSKRKIIIYHSNKLYSVKFEGVKYVIDAAVSEKIMYHCEYKRLFLIHEGLHHYTKSERDATLCNIEGGVHSYLHPCEQYDFKFDSPFSQSREDRNADYIWWLAISSKQFDSDVFGPIFEKETTPTFMKAVNFEALHSRHQTFLTPLLMHLDYWSLTFIINSLNQNPDIIMAAIQYAVFTNLPPMSFWNGYMSSGQPVTCVTDHGDIFNSIFLYRKWLKREVSNDRNSSYDVMMKHVHETVTKIADILSSAGVDVSPKQEQFLTEEAIIILKAIIFTISDVMPSNGFSNKQYYDPTKTFPGYIDMHPGSACTSSDYRKRDQIVSHVFVKKTAKKLKLNASQITCFSHEEVSIVKEMNRNNKDGLRFEFDLLLRCLHRLQQQMKTTCQSVSGCVDDTKNLERDLLQTLEIIFNKVTHSLKQSPTYSRRFALREYVSVSKAYHRMLFQSPYVFSKMWALLGVLKSERFVCVQANRGFEVLKWTVYILSKTSVHSKVLVVMKSASECRRMLTYVNSSFTDLACTVTTETSQFGAHLESANVVLTTPLTFLFEAVQGVWLNWFTHIVVDTTSNDNVTSTISQVLLAEDRFAPRAKLALIGQHFNDRAVSNCINIDRPMIRDELVHYCKINSPLVELSDAVILKVLEIHKSGESGGIQVFLPCPSDCDSCSRKLMERSGSQVLTVLQDYELSETNAQLFTQENGARRKVIFTCEGAQQGYIYPGVKYIIDTGIHCDLFYDPAIKRNVVKVTKGRYLSGGTLPFDRLHSLSASTLTPPQSLMNASTKVSWQSRNCSVFLHALSVLVFPQNNEEGFIQSITSVEEVTEDLDTKLQDPSFLDELYLLTYIDFNLMPLIRMCYSDNDEVLLITLQTCLFIMHPPLRYWSREDLKIQQGLGGKCHGDLFNMIYLYGDCVGNSSRLSVCEKLPSSVKCLFDHVHTSSSRVFKYLKGYEPSLGISNIDQYQSCVNLVKRRFASHFDFLITMPNTNDHTYELLKRMPVHLDSDVTIQYLNNGKTNFIGPWLVTEGSTGYLTSLIILNDSGINQGKIGSTLDFRNVPSKSELKVGPFGECVLENLLSRYRAGAFLKTTPENLVELSVDRETKVVILRFASSKCDKTLLSKAVVDEVRDVRDVLEKTSMSVNFPGIFSNIEAIITSGSVILDLKYKTFESGHNTNSSVCAYQSPEESVKLPYLILPKGRKGVSIDWIRDGMNLRRLYCDQPGHSVDLVRCCKDSVLTIQGTDEKMKYHAWVLAFNFIRGHVIPVSHDQVGVLRSKFGRTNLKAISNETDSCVTQHKNGTSISVSGSPDSANKAVSKVLSFLTSLQKASRLRLKFREEGYGDGFVKAVQAKFGPALRTLEKTHKVWFVELNLKQGTIYAIGKSKSILPLEISLQGMAETCDSPMVQSVSDCWEVCSLCSSAILCEKKAYRLQLCNHIYCMGCARNVVNAAFEKQTTPIECIHHGCDARLCLFDVCALKLEKYTMSDIILSSRNLFIENSAELLDCPNVHCMGVVRNRETCPACNYQECDNCGLLKHSSFSCEVAKVILGVN